MLLTVPISNYAGLNLKVGGLEYSATLRKLAKNYNSLIYSSLGFF